MSGFPHAITSKNLASLLAGKNSTLQHVECNLSKPTKSWLILLAGKNSTSQLVECNLSKPTKSWLILLAGKNSTSQLVECNSSKPKKSLLYFWRENLLLYSMWSTTCQSQKKVCYSFGGEKFYFTDCRVQLVKANKKFVILLAVKIRLYSMRSATRQSQKKVCNTFGGKNSTLRHVEYKFSQSLKNL